MGSLTGAFIASTGAGGRVRVMTVGEISERIYLSLTGVSALIGIHGFMLCRNSWRRRQAIPRRLARSSIAIIGPV